MQSLKLFEISPKKFEDVEDYKYIIIIDKESAIKEFLKLYREDNDGKNNFDKHFTIDLIAEFEYNEVNQKMFANEQRIQHDLYISDWENIYLRYSSDYTTQQMIDMFSPEGFKERFSEYLISKIKNRKLMIELQNEVIKRLETELNNL